MTLARVATHPESTVDALFLAIGMLSPAANPVAGTGADWHSWLDHSCGPGHGGEAVIITSLGDVPDPS